MDAKPTTAEPLLATDSPADTNPWGSRNLQRIAWGLIALGVAIRVFRFALRFPLWGDEAFVAANFIDRGFLDLLRPLDYHQVCPLGFLWVEWLSVRCFGFNEYALRLPCLVAGVLGLALFVPMARTMLRGLPLVLAIGILSVGYYPVRHSAEVKPYASDLLITVLLLWPALLAWRRPLESRWWWCLAGLSPLALAGSHPAAFVAGGISIASFARVFHSRQPRLWIAFAACNAVLLAAFVLLYKVFTAEQYATQIAAGGMAEIWKDAFPPWREPLRLAAWLVDTHTGHMFAYPLGGKRGGSIATTLACLAGLAWLWRRARTDLAALWLAPFALALLAAAMHRYPYGGSQRTMQYTAPIICLMAGLGAAVLLERVKRDATRRHLTAAAICGLAVLGFVSAVRDVARPYKTRYDLASRTIVRQLIATTPPETQLVCVYRDLGRDLAPGCFEWEHSARYQCNLAIYGPARSRPAPAKPFTLENAPLRCVVYSVPHFQVEPARREVWLDEMERDHRLVGHGKLDVHADSPTHHEWYEIYAFQPRGYSRTAAQPASETR